MATARVVWSDDESTNTLSFIPAVDRSPGLLWWSDKDGRTTFNLAFQEFAGLAAASDAPGTAAAGLVHLADRARFLSEFRRASTEGAPFSIVARMRRHDGVYRRLCIVALPRFSEVRGLIGFSGGAIDADRLGSRPGDSATSSRSDTLLATLGRELREPLSAIEGALGLLECAGERARRVALASITRQLSHLARLADELTEWGGTVDPDTPLQLARLDLAALVAAAVERRREDALSRRQQIVEAVPSNALEVEVDPERLAQVIGTLLDHAIRTGRPNGTIFVDVRRAGKAAIISVRDNGLGMSATQLRAVFDLSITLRQPVVPGDGPGIGLALARRLVEAHGGRMTAQSAGIGRGTEFTVQIPLAAERGGDDTRPSGQPATVSARPRRVLVVDDHPDTVEVLATLFRLRGHDVRTALDGSAAMAIAFEFRPQLVLLDLTLPHQSGVDVCRAIRSQPWGRAVVIAAVTGWTEERHRREAEQAGFDRFLVKPLEPEAVGELLDAASDDRLPSPDAGGDATGGPVPRRRAQAG